MAQPPRRRSSIVRRASTLRPPQLQAQTPLLVAPQNQRSRANREALLAALMRQGSSTAPVQSITEGAARALQAGVGGLFQGLDDRADRERRKAEAQRLAAALGGAGGAGAAGGAGGTGGAGIVGGPGQTSVANSALAQALLDNPATRAAAEQTLARRQFPSLFEETLSPRDAAFAGLTPEQQAQALGANPPTQSARDQAFSNLTPEQQTRVLGAAPPVQSVRDQAFASLTPEQQAVALGATDRLSPRDQAFANLTPEQQATALGANPNSTLTAAQQANNAEIDQARRALKEEGLTQDDIRRLTQSTTDTDRANPEFRPDLERIVRLATQRKVGDDPDFQRTFQRFLGTEPPAIPTPIGTGVDLSSLQPPATGQRQRAPIGGQPAPQTPPTTAGGRPRTNPADRTPGPRQRTPAAVRPGGPGGGANTNIGQMGVADLTAFVDGRGGEQNLSPEESAAVDARLRALGF